MRVNVSTEPIPKISAGLLATFSFEGEEPKQFKQLNEVSASQLSESLKSGEFKGKEGETLLIHCKGKVKHVFLVGLGKREQFELQAIRAAAGKCVAQAKKLKLSSLTIALEDKILSDVSLVSQAIVEGAILASYSFNKYKTEKDNGDKKTDVNELNLAVSSQNTHSVSKGVSVGVIMGESQNLARSLCNEPPNYATPSKIAEIAEQLSKQYNLKTRVFGASELKRMKMNALLAVASGSVQEPKLILLEYLGGKEKICLVGKGITFDSGGISIKPSKDMEKMKYDKSGAITVIAAAIAASRLRLPLHVAAIAPLTENTPSGSAYKPSDIIKTSSGKTIEIQNTDAEGRVVLADALSFASSVKPSAIIDVATLTGACVVALGNVAAGIMGNNAKLIEKVKQAGAESGEKVWELPMWKEYGEMIKSDVADVKNVGVSGQAGTITAAKFLEKFVSAPWVHVDIAGTVENEREKPELAKGATGYGVRLLTTLLKNWKK